MNTKRQRIYLTDIMARIEQIERFTSEGRDAFLADDRTQEAVIRCFEVIGEIVKRLDSALLARPQVWETVEQDLPNLRAAVEALLAGLPPTDDEEAL